MNIKERIINLPWPPSNSGRLMFGARARGKLISFVSSSVRKYKKEVKEKQEGQRPLRGRLKVMVKAFPPDRRQRNLSGLLKVPLDALEDVKVYFNDSQIDSLSILRMEKYPKGSLTLQISSAEEVKPYENFSKGLQFLSNNRLCFAASWPPSNNNCYLHIPVRKGKVKVLETPKYIKFKEEIENLNFLSKEGDISIEIIAYPPDKRVRDLDNILVVIMTALKKAGMYINHNQIRGLNIDRGETCLGGRVHVEIKYHG